MFEDSLVGSSGRLSARHPWATFASFAVQSVVIASLLLLSLVYTESLPGQRWIRAAGTTTSAICAGNAQRRELCAVDRQCVECANRSQRDSAEHRSDSR